MDVPKDRAVVAMHGAGDAAREAKTATVRALENEGVEFHQDRKRAYVSLDLKKARGSRNK